MYAFPTTRIRLAVSRLLSIPLGYARLVSSIVQDYLNTNTHVIGGLRSGAVYSLTTSRMILVCELNSNGEEFQYFKYHRQR